MLVELRGKIGELFLDRFEACLSVVRKLGAAEAKITELVVDHPLLCRAEFGERRRRLERAILAEQPRVLTKICIKRRDLRQIGVKRIAQRRRVDDGIQVTDGAPGTLETIEAIDKWCHDVVPRRWTRIGGNRFDRGACVRQQLIDGRRHICRFDGVETRQAGKFEQRV